VGGRARAAPQARVVCKNSRRDEPELDVGIRIPENEMDSRPTIKARILEEVHHWRWAESLKHESRRDR
jgi:hypothetical protein